MASAAERPWEAPAADVIGSGPPTFIGGMGRSGTTLVAQLLGSHSQIAVPPTELRFFGPEFGARLDVRMGIPGRREFERLARMLHRARVHEWELDEEELVAAARKAECSYRELFVLVLDLYRRKVGKPRIAEKTPLYERHLHVLDDWFGDYRFVHMIRNPVDALASLRRYRGHPYETDLLLWIHEWNRSARTALHRAHRDPSRYCYVRYEDLVARTEAELERVCRIVGVAPEASMAAMAGVVNTENSSFADLPASRGYAARVRRFDDIERRAFLSAEERAAVCGLCGSLAHVLGYELELPRRRRGSLGRLPYGRVPPRLAASFELRRLWARLRSVAAERS